MGWMTLNASIPRFECFVRHEFLYNFEKTGFDCGPILQLVDDVSLIRADSELKLA